MFFFQAEEGLVGRGYWLKGLVEVDGHLISVTENNQNIRRAAEIQ